METRRLLSSIASASLLFAGSVGAGCGAPLDPQAASRVGVEHAAVVSPAAGRLDGTAAVRASAGQLTHPAASSNQGTAQYIDVGTPTGTIPAPAGDLPAPSGSTPGSPSDPDPGTAEPGAPQAGQILAPTPGQLPDPACTEQALDLTPACYRDLDLIVQAGAACPNDQLADRVLLVDSCVGGHQGASVRCCPAKAEPEGGKPQVCKARVISNHDQCLSQSQFLAHATSECRHEGMVMSEPSFDAGDCQGGAVNQLRFACCYAN